VKLRNWHIDGFGVFCGARLPEPGLGDGLNLFLGPNEAGKSTLLDFLRYTLLGYPGGRASLPRREPLRGGSHGGTLIYEADALMCHLHRRSGRVNAFQLRDQAGTAMTETDLAGQVGHISPEVFRNIFGFSLKELQDLDSLSQSGVRDLIFAASIGQSAGRIRSVQDDLQKQADTLFREGARANAQAPPRLVKLLADLSEQERRLAQATETSRAVAAKVRELGALRTALGEFDRRIREAELEIQRLDRLIKGWPLWVERRQAEDERTGLADADRFPADGDAAWATRKTEFEKAKADVRLICDEVKALREELIGLPAEFPSLPVSTQVTELAAEKADYDVAVRLGHEAETRAGQAREGWSQLSKELGADWPEEAVRSFDVSLLGEDDARRLANAVQEARNLVGGTRTTAANLAREARALSTDCALKVKQLADLNRAGPILAPEQLAQQRLQLGRFREALRKREGLRGECERANDHLTQVRLFMSRREPAAGIVPNWLRPALFIGGAVMVLASVGLFLAGQQVAAALGLVAGALFAGIGLLLPGSRPVQAAVDGAPELSAAQRRHEEAQKAVEKQDVEMKAEAAQHGFGWPMTEDHLTQLEGNITAAERRADRHNTLLNELGELRNKKAGRRDAFTTAKRDLKEARLSFSSASQAWTDFLRNRRLPETIQSETALAVFSKVKQARQVLDDLHKLTATANGQRDISNAYLKRLRPCLQQANWPAEDESAKLLAAFEQLRQRVVDESQQSEHRRGRLEDLAKAKKDLKDAGKIAKAKRGKCDEFLRQIGAASEQGFGALSERSKRYHELSQSINAKDTGLKVIFGQSGPPAELQEAWDSGHRPDWEAKKSSRETERTGLHGERDQGLQDIRQLEIEIDGQLKSDEVASLQLEAESLREQLREGVLDWLKVATARELLEQTREKFERENQSPAIEEASRLFRLISGGRYERITIPLDSTDLTIVPQTGPMLSLESLSRGTLEQLYLCIRLGYIRHYQQQQRVGLPLLMDDVAVNFDTERMAKTFELLGECCRVGQQILFFTCHEELVRLLRPEHKLFRIRNCEFETAAL
jgi:uncharacterized protein YhaN